MGESVDCTHSAPKYEELDFKEREAESLAGHATDKRTLSKFTPPENSYANVASQAMDVDGISARPPPSTLRASFGVELPTPFRAGW